MTKEIQSFIRREPDKGGAMRRIWPIDLKRDIMAYYYSFEPYHSNRIALLKALKINSHTLCQWKDRDKITIVATVKPLKAESIAAGGRIIGTTLANVLHAIPANDIVSQVEMVDILSLAGYKEDNLIEKLNTTLPTIEDWKRIKSALKMLDEIYDITITEKDNK